MVAKAHTKETKSKVREDSMFVEFYDHSGEPFTVAIIEIRRVRPVKFFLDALGNESNPRIGGGDLATQGMTEYNGCLLITETLGIITVKEEYQSVIQRLIQLGSSRGDAAITYRFSVSRAKAGNIDASNDSASRSRGDGD